MTRQIDLPQRTSRVRVYGYADIFCSAELGARRGLVRTSISVAAFLKFEI